MVFLLGLVPLENIHLPRGGEGENGRGEGGRRKKEEKERKKKETNVEKMKNATGLSFSPGSTTVVYTYSVLLLVK